MTRGERRTLPAWHIVESGDRWFQAVLRFRAPGSAEVPQVVRRWDVASATGLIALAAQTRQQPAILLWELPHEAPGLSWTLDAMATIKCSGSGAMQLVHLPPRCSNATALLALEAGASLLVEDLWSLQRIFNRLTSTATMSACISQFAARSAQ